LFGGIFPDFDKILATMVASVLKIAMSP